MKHLHLADFFKFKLNNKMSLRKGFGYGSLYFQLYVLLVIQPLMAAAVISLLQPELTGLKPYTAV